MITFTWLHSPYLLYPAAVYGMGHAWDRLLGWLVLPDGRWRWEHVRLPIAR